MAEYDFSNILNDPSLQQYKTVAPEDVQTVVPDRGIMGDIRTTLFRSGMRGLQMGGDAFEAWTGKDVALDDWVDDQFRTSKWLAPDYGEYLGTDSKTYTGMRQGVESFIPSLGAGWGGALIGGALTGTGIAPGPGTIIGGVTGLVLFMGGSQYQQTFDEVIKAGGSQEDAHKAGIKSAAWETIPEMVTMFPAMKALNVGYKVTKPVIGKAVKEYLKKGDLKKSVKQVLGMDATALAKAFGFSTSIETLSEMATAWGQSGVAQEHIDESINRMDAVKDSIIPALTMSTIFSVGTGSIGYMGKKRLVKEMNDLKNPEKRQLIADKISEGVRKEDAELADAWDIFTKASIENNQPVELWHDVIRMADNIQNAQRANAVKSVIDDPKGTILSDTEVDKRNREIYLDRLTKQQTKENIIGELAGPKLEKVKTKKQREQYWARPVTKMLTERDEVARLVDADNYTQQKFPDEMEGVGSEQAFQEGRVESAIPEGELAKEGRQLAREEAERVKTVEEQKLSEPLPTVTSPIEEFVDNPKKGKGSVKRRKAFAEHVSKLGEFARRIARMEPNERKNSIEMVRKTHGELSAQRVQAEVEFLDSIIEMPYIPLSAQFMGTEAAFVDSKLTTKEVKNIAQGIASGNKEALQVWKNKLASGEVNPSSMDAAMVAILSAQTPQQVDEQIDAVTTLADGTTVITEIEKASFKKVVSSLIEALKTPFMGKQPTFKSKKTFSQKWDELSKEVEKYWKKIVEGQGTDIKAYPFTPLKTRGGRLVTEELPVTPVKAETPEKGRRRQEGKRIEVEWTDEDNGVAVAGDEKYTIKVFPYPGGKFIFGINNSAYNEKFDSKAEAKEAAERTILSKIQKSYVEEGADPDVTAAPHDKAPTVEETEDQQREAADAASFGKGASVIGWEAYNTQMSEAMGKAWNEKMEQTHRDLQEDATDVEDTESLAGIIMHQLYFKVRKGGGKILWLKDKSSPDTYHGIHPATGMLLTAFKPSKRSPYRIVNRATNEVWNTRQTQFDKHVIKFVDENIAGNPEDLMPGMWDRGVGDGIRNRFIKDGNGDLWEIRHKEGTVQTYEIYKNDELFRHGKNGNRTTLSGINTNQRLVEESMEPLNEEQRAEALSIGKKVVSYADDILEQILADKTTPEPLKVDAQALMDRQFPEARIERLAQQAGIPLSLSRGEGRPARVIPEGEKSTPGEIRASKSTRTLKDKQKEIQDKRLREMHARNKEEELAKKKKEEEKAKRPYVPVSEWKTGRDVVEFVKYFSENLANLMPGVMSEDLQAVYEFIGSATSGTKLDDVTIVDVGGLTQEEIYELRHGRTKGKHLSEMWYDPETNQIFVDSNKVDFNTEQGLLTLAHDIAHAVTSHELVNDKEAQTILNSVRELMIKSKLTPAEAKRFRALKGSVESFYKSEFAEREDSDILYGLLNNDELIGQTFGSKTFREAASNVQDKTAKKTLKQKFWSALTTISNTILKLLGAQQSQRSQLDRIFEVSSTLMQAPRKVSNKKATVVRDAPSIVQKERDDIVKIIKETDPRKVGKALLKHLYDDNQAPSHLRGLLGLIQQESGMKGLLPAKMNVHIVTKQHLADGVMPDGTPIPAELGDVHKRGAYRASKGPAKSHDIFLKDNSNQYTGLTNETIGHEIVHAAFGLRVEQLSNMDNAEFKKQPQEVQDAFKRLENIFKSVRGAVNSTRNKTLRDRLSPGVQSLQEFVAHGLTDAKLVEVLRKVKLDKVAKFSDRKKLSPMWIIEELVDSLRNLFGITKAEVGTAYGELLSASLELKKSFQQGDKYKPTSIAKELVLPHSTAIPIDSEIWGIEANMSKWEQDVHGWKTKFDDYVGSIFKNIIRDSMSELEKLAPKTYARIQERTANVSKRTTKAIAQIRGFFEAVDNLSTDQRKELAYFLSLTEDEDIVKRNDYIKSIGIWDDYKTVRPLLDGISKELIAEGLLKPQLRKEYFPMLVDDVKGLEKYLRDRDNEARRVKGKDDIPESKILREIQWAEEKHLRKFPGTKFADVDKVHVINQAINSGIFHHPLNTRKAGSTKKRTVFDMDRDMMKFYADPIDALRQHIFETAEAIETSKALGSFKVRKKIYDEMHKIEQKDTHTEADEKRMQELLNELLPSIDQEVEGSIGALLAEETELNKDDRKFDRAKRILRAVLIPRMMNRTMKRIRNVSLMTALGSPLTAITQLTDILWSFYAHGFIPTMKALFTWTKAVTMKEIDAQGQLRDFAQGDSAKALERILSATGLKLIDGFGKKVFMTAAMHKARKQSPEAFEKDWGMFLKPDVLKKTHDAIKSWKPGTKLNPEQVEDVYVWMWNNLSRWVPVDRSRMPLYYMENPNAAIFYVLKSYGIKQLNNFYDEYQRDVAKGGKMVKARAAAKMSAMVSLMALANAGTDEMKDYLKGKDKPFADSVHDNFWQMLLTSKFSVEKGLRGDMFSVLIHDILDVPATRVPDAFFMDMVNLVKGEPTAKTLGEIPILPTKYPVITNFMMSPQFWKYRVAPSEKEKELKNRKKYLNESIKAFVEDGKKWSTVRDRQKSYNELASDLGEKSLNMGDINKTKNKYRREMRESK